MGLETEARLFFEKFFASCFENIGAKASAKPIAAGKKSKKKKSDSDADSGALPSSDAAANREFDRVYIDISNYFINKLPRDHKDYSSDEISIAVHLALQNFDSVLKAFRPKKLLYLSLDGADSSWSKYSSFPFI